MTEKQPVLCYVDEPWAYFTTQNLSDQWGDDWGDAPYEHNAGEPYEYGKHDEKQGRQPWEITKIAWDGALDMPCDYYYNSPCSVQDINSGAVAWFRSPSYLKKKIVIPAGTTLKEFCKLIGEAGGTVYLPSARK